MRRKYCAGFLGILLCILLVSMDGFASADETQTITIGYVLNCGTVKSPKIKDSEGYLYEYLNTVTTYLDEDYVLEFVQCKSYEAYSLLDSGAIDIFAPISYKEDVAENFTYSSMDVGSAEVYLATLADNIIYFNNYEKLNGETIAVKKGDVNRYLLEEFIEEYNIDCEIIEVEDDVFIEKMENGEYSYCLSNSMETYSGIKSVAYLGTVETYLLVAQDNTDLLEVFEGGMFALAEAQYLYKEELYLKYFSENLANNSYISQLEYDLLQVQSTYYVGYSANYHPLAYVNEEGEIVGVAVEILNQIAEEAHLSLIYLDVDDPDTNAELIDISIALQTSYDETDCLESESYLELPLILLEKNINTEEVNYIGVLDYYGMEEDSLVEYKSNCVTVEYSLVEEMLSDFQEGYLQGIVLTSIGLNKASTSINTADYMMTFLDVNLGVSFLYPGEMSYQKVHIFDKLIMKIDDVETEISLSEHMLYEEAQTLGEYLQEHTVTIMGMVLVFFILVGLLDASQRKKVKYLTEHDELTGLLTTYKFNSESKKMLKSYSLTKYSIFSVDIDNFKYINELYGYEVGTQILIKFSEFVQDKLPANSPMARRFADNFAILVRSDDLDGKVGLALDSSNEIYQVFRDILGDRYNISFSIGIYDIEDRGLNFSYMVDCANIARLEGKDKTGNTVNRYTSEVSRVRDANKDIITNMNQGITNQEFVVYYQNKNDMSTGEIIGAEALIRWFAPDRSRYPGEFIPIFEKNGFIEKLDYYVLTRVCEFIQEHREKQLPQISVNLSGVTFMQSDVVEKIERILGKYGILTEEIEVEITESAFIENTKSILEKITKLKELGISISMDDFGTGISSLNRLKELPIDILKLDKALIDDAMGNEKGIVILKNTINMAHELNLKLVAEGVESLEQAQLLLQLGCRIGQGYYYARPCSEELFLTNLSQEKIEQSESSHKEN